MALHFGGSESPFLIAGPCVVESDDLNLRVGEALAELGARLGVHVIYKASYDKANRSRLKGARGPGLERGLGALAKVRGATGLPILTDVHETHQVPAAAQVADVLQIPAFLCRQTDLLVAAAQTGRAVNVKKGQFVSPWDMRHAVEKVRGSGNDRVLLTERGSSFGYNNLVVDMRSLPIMRKLAPVVFDATHSVQLPSAGTDAQSGGQPEYIPILARAAVAAGVDGIFLEVHDNPPEAKSDGANALHSTKLREVLKELLAVQRAVGEARAKP